MAQTIDRREILKFTSAGAIASFALPAIAADIYDDASWLDPLVGHFMNSFDVPGFGITILRPSKPPIARGYGIRTLGKTDKVDEHTLFAIASNSKAFTATALAMLVDDGKVEWEAPVTRYIPEFAMSDPAVTAMMTVRDLLVHSSGLPLGAGDLMQFPETTHSIADIVHGLRYLPLETGFRTRYAYDNVLYIVAGEVIARASGMSWQDFIAARILRPLGMADSVPVLSRIRTANVAGRHARLGPPLRGMGPMQRVAPDEQDKIGAAGGINASAYDAAAWLQFQLDRGRLSNGKRLFSEAQADAMWTPRTLLNGNGKGPDLSNPGRSVLGAYALGWGVHDYRGQRLISHSGGLTGQATEHALLPDRGFGVAVYSNVEERTARALRNAILDHLLGAPAFDWVAARAKDVAQEQGEALKEMGAALRTPPPGGPSLALDVYAGRYRDPWYGDVVVMRTANGLSIDFTRTPAFKSALEPWGKDAFRTRFAPGVGEDAVVQFKIEAGRISSVTMKALSPLADFSFDFQHLQLVPVR
ncbi:serine hydrolase [Sphingomonas sp. DBB INV C78]